ncbi:MAG: hypothetical protein LBB24_03290, partial [Rickettsiales bacterium]|nr:hypothetical protein [Rickettsiales bacterium]
MKKSLLIIPGLAMLAYFVLLTVARNRLNAPEIKSRINNALSREIEEYRKNHFFQDKNVRFSVDGKIELSIFPSAKLKINNLNLSEIQYRDYLVNLNIKKIEIKLSFISLMRSKVGIVATVVDGVAMA